MTSVPLSQIYSIYFQEKGEYKAGDFFHFSSSLGSRGYLRIIVCVLSQNSQACPSSLQNEKTQPFTQDITAERIFEFGYEMTL